MELFFVCKWRAMFSYVAYGLNIESEVHLPELSAGRSTRPDVIVRRDRIDTFEPNITHRNHRACFDDIQFSYDGVGRFRVRRGREIVVAAEPGADSTFLRVCLLGPALAALLHQRGLLVLHGSALKMNGQGIAFLGGKGWGKSTLAAYMHSRGHTFLADDLVALGARLGEPVQLTPGFPHLKLWPNSAIYLQLDLNKMTRLHPAVEKRGHRLDGDLPPALSNLRSIYVLDIGDREMIERLEPRQAFVELVRHTFLAGYLAPTGTAPVHLDQCAKVVSSVPIYSLRRPRTLLRLPELAGLLEDHIAN